MSTTFLGIDGGASSAKWCLIDESGSTRESGVLGPIDGHVYREESRSRLTKFLELVKTGISTLPSAIHLGLTGAPENFEAQVEIRKLIAASFGDVPLAIENDVYLGYRAAFRDVSGIFLYAGTGSIAVFKDAKGNLKRVGGWGYLLGDEGGGYWIGREAIRSALFALEDNRESELSQVIFSCVGGRDWDEIKKFVYSSSREEIASLAPPILDLAEKGDAEARKIAWKAGIELADLVKRSEMTLGARGLPVIFSGGIASASNLVTESIERELGLSIKRFMGDTAYQAALIAKQNYSPRT